MSADKSLRSGFYYHLKSRMISGLLVLGPLFITLFVLKMLFAALTAFILPLIQNIPVFNEVSSGILGVIATVLSLLLIYLVGMFTRHFIGQKFIRMGERLMLKLPIVRSVYSASRQVVDTFSSSTKTSFSATVLVSFPHPGSKAVGFVTGTMTGPDGVCLFRIFVATTPNPTSGFLLLLPESEITFTDITVEDGIKMIVSGGMLAPTGYACKEAPSNTSP